MSDSSLVCFGDDGNGQIDVPAPNSGFVAVYAGAYHNCGLKSDSSLVCFGYNSLQQSDVPTPN